MSDANNNHKAKDLFLKRNRYKLSNGFAVKNTYANEGILIGKINLFDSPIVPKKQKLVNLDNNSVIDGSRIAALDFVRLAFDSMNQRFVQGIASGKATISEQNPTPLETFRAYAGYEDPLERYKNYMNFFLENTRIYLNNPNVNKMVDSFQKYIEIFFFISREIINTYPLLYTDYIVSKKNTQLTSGLILELDNHIYDDDAYKTRFYYNHPNFTYINNLSVAFGFRIDKNIPWRFIADINSTQMRYYMRICDKEFENYYSASTKDILKKYYTTPFDDYTVLVNLLYNGYLEFLQKYPYVKKYDNSPCANTNDGRLVVRNPSSNLNKNVLKYIFKEFIYFKNVFHDFRLTEQEINILKNKINYILDTTNRYSAGLYLNNVFNKNDNMYGSINHTLTNLSILENGDNYEASDIITRSIKNSRFNNSGI